MDHSELVGMFDVPNEQCVDPTWMGFFKAHYALTGNLFESIEAAHTCTTEGGTREAGQGKPEALQVVEGDGEGSGGHPRIDADADRRGRVPSCGCDGECVSGADAQGTE